MSTLVILESALKCQSVEAALGPAYKALACYGHIRDLVGLSDIDVAGGTFEPRYTRTQNAPQVKQLARIAAAARSATRVIIATDHDTEGEAIGYALCLELGLDPGTTPRMRFSEITAPALRQAMQSLGVLDMGLVAAQKARNIVDVMIGYSISPRLWANVKEASGGSTKRPLSAGRCQTPALHLVVENSLASNFGDFGHILVATAGRQCVEFTFNRRPTDPQTVAQILQSFTSAAGWHPTLCRSATPGQVCVPPPCPLTTQRALQLASSELRMPVAATTRNLQALYEAGLVTYIRTDCSRYSSQFVASATEYITSTFGSAAVSDRLSDVTKRSASDGAHEAIRPTSLAADIAKPAKITADAWKLYLFVRKIAIQSCMSDYVADVLQAHIPGTQPDDRFEARFECERSPGWKAADPAHAAQSTEQARNWAWLMSHADGTDIKVHQITAQVSKTGSTLHLTEASLIKLLEKHGIGRPSTLPGIIAKIQGRDYVRLTDVPGSERECTEYRLVPVTGELTETVVKRVFGSERQKLVLQPVGEAVNEYLYLHFADLFGYGYTRDLELELDAVARGEREWQSVCAGVWARLSAVCAAESKPVRISARVAAPSADKCEPRVLGMHEGEPVAVSSGRYGLYATWKGRNYKLGSEPATVEDIVDLLLPVREIGPGVTVREGKTGACVMVAPLKGRGKPRFISLSRFSGGDPWQCPAEELMDWVRAQPVSTSRSKPRAIK